MKIRDKLFLAFSLYIFFAATLGFFAYKELRTVSKRLALVELADDITNNLLEVRRHEKNFMLFSDKDSLNELRSHLGVLKTNINNIQAEIIKEIGIDNYNKMKMAIAEYENSVDKIVKNVQSQGELVILARNTGLMIERKFAGKELQTLLVLRRLEKNLMLYKDSNTYESFIKNFTLLNSNGEAVRYRMLVEKLYSLYKAEKVLIEKIRLSAREIQTFTVNLSKKERADINAILDMSVKLLIYALVVTILLGTIINMKLSMSISRPLGRLERVTQKVAMGDFSEAIDVKGNDEIASLESSFNQMEVRLKDAMNSLEYAIERLQEKQAQLLEAEKLASIGKFAAGIAHEINNPLTSVLTFSHLLLEQYPAGDPAHDKLKMMARDTERARNIVKQLLSFAREAPLKVLRMNVNRPVAEVIDSLAAQEAFKDIELIVDLSEALPDIDIDPMQISQVVQNILMNAIHSITPPGIITVTTALEVGFVDLIFSDTGQGIPEENLGKIFDPFFTTKEVNKGTGLGLAVSYGIIKKHGGYLEVKSTVGKGTTFTVKLPLTKRADGGY